MTSYYDVETRLRYYARLPEFSRIENWHVFGKLGSQAADVDRWKESPHEVLANIRRSGEFDFCDSRAVEAFVRRYGLLWGRSNDVTSDFDESCSDFSIAQATLCRAWRNNELGELEAQVEYGLDFRVLMKDGSIELITENLWSFVCVLFLRDYFAGIARVCESPDCTNPYFLAKRGGQKYCSHVCAVRENVRRFRKAEFLARQKKNRKHERS